MIERSFDTEARKSRYIRENMNFYVNNGALHLMFMSDEDAEKALDEFFSEARRLSKEFDKLETERLNRAC